MHFGFFESFDMLPPGLRVVLASRYYQQHMRWKGLSVCTSFASSVTSRCRCPASCSLTHRTQPAATSLPCLALDSRIPGRMCLPHCNLATGTKGRETVRVLFDPISSCPFFSAISSFRSQCWKIGCDYKKEKRSLTAEKLLHGGRGGGETPCPW
jgi:hypothetical protein